jgi:hypothetical protein
LRKAKKAEASAWASENARDSMLATMLVAPGCPEELKSKLVGYFDGIVNDAVASRKK